jgi:dTDP-4-dehydrorhamnose 3,5-epimerase
MKFIDELMPGLILLQAFQHSDVRGQFVKTYNAEAFNRIGIPFEPREIVFSVSTKDVIRGMHFQTPPSDHQKLVSCSAGAIIDVVVDLRSSSPTFRQHAAVELNDKNRHVLLIPRGFAHGFLSLREATLVAYSTDTGHDPSCDSGIRWDSFGYEWPVDSPIISEKDLHLPALRDYQSPF